MRIVEVFKADELARSIALAGSSFIRASWYAVITSD
jgi:hypothetical protein